MTEERLSILSEITEIEALLAEFPKENAILRLGLEGRLENVLGELAALDVTENDPWLDATTCSECGATSLKEAETMCICSGDKDHCHGCEIWED